MVNGEVFISTRKSALNMAYQDITAKPGEIEEVATITGQVCDCKTCVHTHTHTHKHTHTKSKKSCYWCPVNLDVFVLLKLFR